VTICRTSFFKNIKNNKKVAKTKTEVKLKETNLKFISGKPLSIGISIKLTQNNIERMVKKIFFSFKLIILFFLLNKSGRCY
jgi:hypothetical protein